MLIYQFSQFVLRACSQPHELHDEVADVLGARDVIFHQQVPGQTPNFFCGRNEKFQVTLDIFGVVGVDDDVEEKGHGGSGRVECDEPLIISIAFISEFAGLIIVGRVDRTSMHLGQSSSSALSNTTLLNGWLRGIGRSLSVRHHVDPGFHR